MGLFLCTSISVLSAWSDAQAAADLRPITWMHEFKADLNQTTTSHVAGG